MGGSDTIKADEKEAFVVKKREILSALGLAVLLIVGLGFVYMVTVEEDALGVATFHHKTWIPLLVLALGAAGCL